MGFLDSGYGSHPMMSLINFGLRVCQFLLAIATLGLYAKEMEVEGKESGYGYHFSKTATAVVVSCLSIVTAAFFGILPFITVDYFYVAVCFVWDFIISCIWCAIFVFFHSIFQYPYKQVIDVKRNWWERNQATTWVNLTCLLLWLATTIFGIFGLWLGRRDRRVSAV